MDTRAAIKDFISNNFLLASRDGAISDSDSLFSKGVIDSTGILELVGFIEQTFELRVEDEELIPDNLDSIDNIVGFVERKKGAPC